MLILVWQPVHHTDYPFRYFSSLFTKLRQRLCNTGSFNHLHSNCRACLNCIYLLTEEKCLKHNCLLTECSTGATGLWASHLCTLWSHLHHSSVAVLAFSSGSTLHPVCSGVNDYIRCRITESQSCVFKRSSLHHTAQMSRVQTAWHYGSENLFWYISHLMTPMEEKTI